MDYPKTQIEFEQMFSTEEKCLSYLGHIRFENGFFVQNVLVNSIGNLKTEYMYANNVAINFRLQQALFFINQELN